MQFSPFLSINLLNSDSLDLNPLTLTDKEREKERKKERKKERGKKKGKRKYVEKKERK